MNSDKWIEVLSDYLSNSEKYWGKPEERQNLKLIRIKTKLLNQFGLQESSYVEFIIKVLIKRINFPNKIYISNIGGSGSHWLEKMIEELSPGWFEIGEVYLPPFLYNDIFKIMDVSQVAKFYDSIEILHGFLFKLTIDDIPYAKLVNSAHGTRKIPFHKKLFPNSICIHLIRDPRDRTLSVTFRKDEYRKYAHAEKADLDYLIHNSKRTNVNWITYSGQEIKGDIEIKYEDLKRSTSDKLFSIAHLMNENISEEKIDQIVHDFSAENLRNSGDVNKKGNLDQGGIAQTWKKNKNHRYLRIMHSLMKPAIKGFGYELCDCFGLEFINQINHPLILDSEIKKLFSMFSRNIKFLEKEKGWKSFSIMELDQINKVDGVFLDSDGLTNADLIKILKSTYIDQLCLCGKNSKEIMALFNKLNSINVT